MALHCTRVIVAAIVKCGQIWDESETFSNELELRYE